jgi:hypothetical protein
MNKQTKKLLKKLQVAFSNDDLSYAFFQNCHCSYSFTAIFRMKNREHHMEVESLYDYMDVMDMFDFLTGDPLIAVTSDINGFNRKKNEKIVDRFFEMLEDEQD